MEKRFDLIIPERFEKSWNSRVTEVIRSQVAWHLLNYRVSGIRCELHDFHYFSSSQRFGLVNDFVAIFRFSNKQHRHVSYYVVRCAADLMIFGSMPLKSASAMFNAFKISIWWPQCYHLDENVHYDYKLCPVDDLPF